MILWKRAQGSQSYISPIPVFYKWCYILFSEVEKIPRRVLEFLNWYYFMESPKPVVWEGRLNWGH